MRVELRVFCRYSVLFLYWHSKNKNSEAKSSLKGYKAQSSRQAQGYPGLVGWVPTHICLLGLATVRQGFCLAWLKVHALGSPWL